MIVIKTWIIFNHNHNHNHNNYLFWKEQWIIIISIPRIRWKNQKGNKSPPSIRSQLLNNNYNNYNNYNYNNNNNCDIEWKLKISAALVSIYLFDINKNVERSVPVQPQGRSSHLKALQK
jgi:hypothetical protein